MRHVDHQIGADTIGNRAKPAEIDNARIGAASGDNQPRAVRLGQALDFIEVDSPFFAPDTMGNRVEPFAGEVWPGPMREVAARGKRNTEDSVAGLQQRQEYRLVRLGPGMRLDIGERAVK